MNIHQIRSMSLRRVVIAISFPILMPAMVLLLIIGATIDIVILAACALIESSKEFAEVMADLFRSACDAWNRP